MARMLLGWYRHEDRTTIGRTIRETNDIGALKRGICVENVDVPRPDTKISKAYTGPRCPEIRRARPLFLIVRLDLKLFHVLVQGIA